MKEQFADEKTATMVIELGFNLPCLCVWSNDRKEIFWGSQMSSTDLAPTWFQIKQWLWKNHKIDVRRFESAEGRMFGSVSYWKNTPIAHTHQSEDSPITAEIEGIKKAIEYLYEKENVFFNKVK